MFFSFSQRVFNELCRHTFGFRLSVEAFSGFRLHGGNSHGRDRRSVWKRKIDQIFSLLLADCFSDGGKSFNYRFGIVPFAASDHPTLSSSGLGHRPFTAVTRVRIPLGSPFSFRQHQRKGTPISLPSCVRNSFKKCARCSAAARPAVVCIVSASVSNLVTK